MLYIFKQLACALQRLGSYCILHNGIKPSNILVSREGYIKFADFGTSKRGIASDVSGDDDGFCAPSAFVPLGSTSRTMSGSSQEFRVSGGGLSTHRFGAPELTSNASLDTASGLDGLDSLSPPIGLDDDEGAGSVTGAADVWSLALTMLVLATPNQKGPWPSFMQDGVCSDVDSNICIASFAVPLALSDGFSVLLARCMRFKADKRPKPHEIKADIQTLLQPFGKEGNSLKCFCSDDPEVAARNPLTPFVLALQSLTQPKVESDKVSEYLSVVNIIPLKHDAEPADYTQWCTTALRTLERYFGKSEAESGRSIVSSLPGAGTVPVEDDYYLPDFYKFHASLRPCCILKTDAARTATPDTCLHTPDRTTRKTFRGTQHNNYRGAFTAKQRFGHYPQVSSTLSSTPPSPALCTIPVRSPQTVTESTPPIALGKLAAAGVPAALQPAAAKDPTHAMSPEDQSKLFKLKRLYDSLRAWRNCLERLELTLEGYFQDAMDNIERDVAAESLPISLSDDTAELDYPHKRADCTDSAEKEVLRNTLLSMRATWAESRQHPGAEPQPVDADVSRTDVTNTGGSNTLRGVVSMQEEVQKELIQRFTDCTDSAEKELLRNTLLSMRATWEHMAESRQHPEAEPQPVDADVSRTDVTNTRGSNTLRGVVSMQEAVQNELIQRFTDCTDSAEKELLRNTLHSIRATWEHMAESRQHPEAEQQPVDADVSRTDVTNTRGCNTLRGVVNMQEAVQKELIERFTDCTDSAEKELLRNTLLSMRATWEHMAESRQLPEAEQQSVDADVSRTDVMNTDLLRLLVPLPESPLQSQE